MVDDLASKPVKLSSVWDPSEVKRVLDERSAQCVLDAGYAEDCFTSNAKIVLGLLTCACALVAQFYPKPFPDNYWVLLVCVAAYFVLNSALQAFLHFYERDVILTTRPKPPPSAALALSSTLERYSDIYTLSLRPSASPTSTPVELRKSVSSWIYADGELALDALKADVLALLDDHDRQRTKRD